MLMASNSFASISETVFKWKGFILDAIHFHRRFIASPLAELIQQHLKISTSKPSIDLIVLAMMIGLACIRLAIYHPKGSYSRRGDIAAATSMASIIFTTLIGGEKYWGFWFCASLLAMSVIMNTYYNTKRGGATALLWNVYIVFPIIAIGILGALYSGISRSI